MWKGKDSQNPPPAEEPTTADEFSGKGSVLLKGVSPGVSVMLWCVADTNKYMISTNDTQWAVTKKSMKLEGNGEVGGSGRLRGGMQVNMIKMWCVHAQNSQLIKYYI